MKKDWNWQKLKFQNPDIIIKLFIALCIFISSSPYTSKAISLEEYIAQYNPQHANQIAEDIYTMADQYEVDPLFMASIFYVESRYHNEAVSSAGAMGIAQLMPDTAKELGVNPNDPTQNIEGGTRYLKQMLNLQNPEDPYKYNLALASYNAGPANVQGYAPSYTWEYIEMVKEEYIHLRKIIDHEDNWHPEEEPAKQIIHPSKKQRLLKALKNIKKEKLLKRQIKK